VVASLLPTVAVLITSRLRRVPILVDAHVIRLNTVVVPMANLQPMDLDKRDAVVKTQNLVAAQIA